MDEDTDLIVDTDGRVEAADELTTAVREDLDRLAATLSVAAGATVSFVLHDRQVADTNARPRVLGGRAVARGRVVWLLDRSDEDVADDAIVHPITHEGVHLGFVVVGEHSGAVDRELQAAAARLGADVASGLIASAARSRALNAECEQLRDEVVRLLGRPDALTGGRLA